MPRKVYETKDLERGKRLREERKKIWKSRDEFLEETGIPARSLENWEASGADISAVALTEIARRGGDVLYILTGKKSAAGAGPAAGDASSTSLNPDQREAIAHFSTLLSLLGEFQREALTDSQFAHDWIFVLRNIEGQFQAIKKTS